MITFVRANTSMPLQVKMKKEMAVTSKSLMMMMMMTTTTMMMMMSNVTSLQNMRFNR